MFDIEDYLSSKGIDFRHAGASEIRMRCFFHGEDGLNAGRLYVNVEPGDKYGVWNCFVCGEKGGANKLRSYFGDAPIPSGEDSLYRHVFEAATRYYEQRLFDDAPDYKGFLYLTEKRGLSEETVIDARIGYSDGKLHEYLIREGISPEEARSSGLVKIDGSDWFREGTVIFPYFKMGRVTQLRGKTIGGKTIGMSGVSSEIYNADAARDADIVLVAEGECFPPQAEVLTTEGWVRFDEYDGRPVAQVDDVLRIEFVEPLALVQKPYVGELTEISNSQRYYSLTTPGHKIPTFKGTVDAPVWTDETASGLRSSARNIARVGYLDGPGVDLTDTEIRFALALAADFSVREHANGRYAHCGLQKERKKNAIRQILAELEIDYKEAPYSNGSEGTYFHFRIPPKYDTPGDIRFFTKTLPQRWLTEMSLAQRNFVLSEQAFWDGNHVPNRDQVEFSSKHYEEVLWMQTMAHTAGYVSTITPRTNQFGSWYKASILFGKQYTSTQSIARNRRNIPYSGDVYCVTVPSGKILVRQNGCISVSGNCDTLVLRQLGYNVVGVPGSQMLSQEVARVTSEAKRVYVLFDNDAAGANGAEKMASAVGPKARVVQIPGKGFDVNDYYLDGHADKSDFDFLLSKSKGGLLVSPFQAFERWTEIEGNPDAAGLKFGVNTLDNALTHGLTPGQIITIIGRTGAGKSLASFNLTMRMSLAQPEASFMIFSLEQTRNEWFERMYKMHNFYFPGSSPMDVVEYWTPRVALVDKNRVSKDQFVDCLDQVAFDMGKMPEFTLIDYLGYWARVFPGNSKEQTSEAIMTIKELGKEYETRFIVPHQANRTGSIGGRLTFDMAKDAATVEETSDMMLSVWRPDQSELGNDETVSNYPRGTVCMEILKSRDGPVGAIAEFQMTPLTLALVPRDDPMYDRAIREVAYAGAGDSFLQATNRHKTGSVDL